jgi:hypothetical protein
LAVAGDMGLDAIGFKTAYLKLPASYSAQL